MSESNLTPEPTNVPEQAPGAAGEAGVPSSIPTGAPSPTESEGKPATPAEPTSPADPTQAQGENPTEPPAEQQGLMHADEEPVKEENANVLGAPEGEYEFKAAEGKELDADLMKEFGAAARELDLSQESAQKLVDKVAPAFEKMQSEKIAFFRKQWAEECKNDPEIGGDNFKENLKGINRAYKQFSTPALRDLLARTGLDSNPEVVRHFYRLAQQTGDSKFIRSQGTGGRDVGDPRDFYKGMEP